MRVLDIGCGVGDFSFLAADVVGPSGTVIGIDRSVESLARAKTRAIDSGIVNVEFRQAEIEEVELGSTVDAVIGRFVLMHQQDPARALSVASRRLRRGGLVAILESHMCGLVAGVHSCPHSHVYDRIVRWLVEVIRAAGAHTDMGLRLRHVFSEAGLVAPRLSLQARVEGGSSAEIYRYIADSLRSMLPLAESLGIATSSISDVDELEHQLKDEVTAGGGVLTSPILVGAWCHRTS